MRRSTVRRGSGSRRPSGPARRPGWSAGGRSRCRARGPLAARDRHRLARHLDLAGVGLQRARQDLHQRRFAGAVRAHQRDDLAARNDEIGAVERPRRGKALVDADRRLWPAAAIPSHRTISPPAPGRGRRSDRRRPRCRPTAAPANPKCLFRRASRPGCCHGSSAPDARSGFRRRRGFRPA